MLRMTRYVNECCGIAGQDQLAYNAEHLVIDKLISLFYQKVKISPDIPLLISQPDAAELFTPFDSQSYTRTLHKSNITVPTVFLIDDLPQISKTRLAKPSYYVYLPWNDMLEEQLQKIAKFYEIGVAVKVDYLGYALYYYPLSLKNGI